MHTRTTKTTKKDERNQQQQQKREQPNAHTPQLLKAKAKRPNDVFGIFYFDSRYSIFNREK